MPMFDFGRRAVRGRSGRHCLQNGECVVPVVLAWVVAMVLLPVVDGLERRGLSRALTSIVLVILLIASIMVIVGVLTVPLTYWLRRGVNLVRSSRNA
jgi:predicted PurR-regulated permease PerM